MDWKLLGRCFQLLTWLLFLKHQRSHLLTRIGCCFEGQCIHLRLVQHQRIRFHIQLFFIFNCHSFFHCFHQVIELLSRLWPRRTWWWWTDRWCCGWCMVWPLRRLEGQTAQFLVTNGLRFHHHIHHSWGTQFRQGLCGRAVWIRLSFWALIIIRMLRRAKVLGFECQNMMRYKELRFHSNYSRYSITPLNALT